MNVFFDTNLLVDVLLAREPFVVDSRRAWHLAERGALKGIVSALSFPNVHYILCRLRGRQAATSGLLLVRGIFEPVPLDAQILNQAIDAGFEDFEDAIQYFSARRAGADCILTRNAAHFPQSGLLVHTPAEFLAAHRF